MNKGTVDTQAFLLGTAVFAICSGFYWSIQGNIIPAFTAFVVASFDIGFLWWQRNE